MHIPDGFLDLRTSAAAGAFAAAGLAIALRAARDHLPARRVPHLGLTAAFVFAAQMLNFPVAAGTSGHLLGGALAAVLLGPSAAVVVLSCVLIVQCLLLADGGLLALGANTFNLAVVPAVVGSAVYGAGVRLMPRTPAAAAAIAAWASTVAAAAACAGELALAGVAPASALFAAMTGVHAVIGVGEAIITGLIVAALARRRPELLASSTEAVRTLPAGNIPLGLLAITGLAVFIAPVACPWPDGLERVAESLRLAPTGPTRPFGAPLAENPDASAGNRVLLTILGAAFGTVAAFAVGWAVSRAIARSDVRIPGAAR